MNNIRSRSRGWSNGQTNIEDAFEVFAISDSFAGRIRPNTRRFTSPFRRRSTGGVSSRVEPDGLAALGVRVEIRAGRNVVVRNPVFEDLVFTEVKTTQESLRVNSGSGAFQMGGLVDAVSQLRNRKWSRYKSRIRLLSPGVVQTRRPRAVLAVLTPSSTRISSNLIAFANRKGVAMYKSTICGTGGVEGVNESQMGRRILINPSANHPIEPREISSGVAGTLVLPDTVPDPDPPGNY